MPNTLFTADLHLGSKNIISYCNRPYNSVEEMNESIVSNWNNKVGKQDVIYMLGDMFWGHNTYEYWLRRLNGQKHLILGNHDNKQTFKKMQQLGLVHSINQHKGIEIDGQYIWMSHYAHRTWNKSHYGSWMLYGHCVDLETEVLTSKGWLNLENISKDDKVINLNLNTGMLEEDAINDIVVNEFSGNVYFIKGKGLELRVTDEHVLIDVSYTTHKPRKFLARDIKKVTKRKFIKAGIFKQNGLNLSDDLLRLLIWITADGSKSNTDLIRVKLYKDRKIVRLRNLLERLNIEYRVKIHKDKGCSLNFTLPYELISYRLKPLDNNIRYCNIQQTQIILEEYSHTDGYKNGNNILIYTSKKEESDIIQEMCIKNGFMCNISSRDGHGYSKKTAYELAVVKGVYRGCELKNTRSVEVQSVNDELFWCLNTNNGTIFVRRNGKPCLIGNCHNTLSDYGLSTDIGCDKWNYSPVSFEELREYFKDRQNTFNLELRDNYNECKERFDKHFTEKYLEKNTSDAYYLENLIK